MIYLINQAIGQTFVNHAPVMANYVHNAMLKMLQDRGTPGFVGPTYQQASQMVFSPTGLTTGIPQIDPQAQVEGKVLDVQPISTVATTQIPPVYTNSMLMATYVLTVLKCHFHPSTILNNKGKPHTLLTYLYH